MSLRSVFPLVVLLFVYSEGCITTGPAVSPSRITGKWVKPINIKPPSGKPGKEGFALKKDGTIAFINIHSMTGDTWKLNNDTLTYWSHTERYPEPQPSKYIVVKLTASHLELRPVKSTRGYSEIYKRER